jgi:hypothetical protein
MENYGGTVTLVSDSHFSATSEVVAHTDNITVEGCAFLGGHLVAHGESSYCIIRDNVLLGGSRVTASSDGGVVVDRNTLIGTGSDCGITILTAHMSCDIGGNTISGYNTGLDVRVMGDPSIHGNAVSGCAIGIRAQSIGGAATNMVYDCGVGLSLDLVYGTIRANTVVACANQAIVANSPIDATFTRNNVVGNNQGVVFGAVGNLVVSCNNSWGNSEGDWLGIPDPTGTEGNICANPLFCGEGNPGEPFSLMADSPCLPGNHPDGYDCGLIGALGEGCTASSVPELAPMIPTTRIFPNPTPGPITIDFTLPTSGWISAEILDVSGRVVRELFSGTEPNGHAGELSLMWDGRDDAGKRVAAGVYVARVQGPGCMRANRVVVAR